MTLPLLVDQWRPVLHTDACLSITVVINADKASSQSDSFLDLRDPPFALGIQHEISVVGMFVEKDRWRLLLPILWQNLYIFFTSDQAVDYLLGTFWLMLQMLIWCQEKQNETNYRKWKPGSNELSGWKDRGKNQTIYTSKPFTCPHVTICKIHLKKIVT